MAVAIPSPSVWYWYFGRATGLVALVLLTSLMVLGLLGPLHVASDRWPRFAIRNVHRDVSLVTLVVIAIHAVVMVLDGYVYIPISAVVLPFGSVYRPFWTALGAVAFDLMIGIVVTSLLRRRLGVRTWRSIHWLAYASWPIAVAHGLGGGHDSGSVWALGLTILCILIVVVVTVIRIVFGNAARTLEA